MPTTSVMVTRRGQFRAIYRELQRRPGLAATTPVIFCEGDSWFSTPLSMNALDWLVFPGPADDAAGVPLFGSGGLFFRTEHSGDLAVDIFAAKQVKDLVRWYKGFDFDAVLLSAGGNDFVGEFLQKLFANATGPMTASSAVDRVVASGRFDAVLTAWRRVLTAFTKAKPSVQIISHTYDYPVLLGTPANLTLANLGAAALAKKHIGPWIEPHVRHVLDAAGQVEFAHRLIDGFEARVLQKLRSEFAGVFDYVDLRGLLRREDWFDEMHPTGSGFHLVADAIRMRLVAALPPAKR